MTASKQPKSVPREEVAQLNEALARLRELQHAVRVEFLRISFVVGMNESQLRPLLPPGLIDGPQLVVDNVPPRQRMSELVGTPRVVRKTLLRQDDGGGDAA